MITTDIRYCLITDKLGLGLYLDKIIECCKKMLLRTGEHGQTCEILVKQIIEYVGTDYCHFIIGLDDDDELVGFIFAVQVGDWIEIPALYSKPGIASRLRWEVFDLIKQWGRSRGANKILTVVTRSPDRFYEFFHKPLGFKKVGYLLEAKL